MATFHITNFGCRATQADATAIERQLLDRGYGRASLAADADVVVLNTCTVTSEADAQARQAIRRAHRENPGARILVTGCYAQRAPEDLAPLEGVAWVVGNSHRPEIAGLLECGGLPALSAVEGTPLSSAGACSRATDELSFVPVGELSSFPSSTRGPARILTGDIFAEDPVPFAPSAEASLGGHTRPVLKIQDGCNNRCSYCVIPFVRGRSRSLSPAQVVEEIRKLAAAGSKEVVLSGINLGSYGRDLTPRVELADLVRRILDETSLPRLRISSIEPMDVTQDLINLFASSRRIARHFHIPLQSGSDRILAAMHRWYRTAHYARRLELIRERLPGAAIGADLIAGFPGESEADHAATLALVERLPFTYLHVFAFSKRPGTKAATMDGEVPPQVIKQRSKQLRALAAQKGAAFRAAHVGRTLRVLTLHRQGENWTGALSDNYLNVRIPGRWPANTFLDARITADAGSHLTGDVT